MFAVCVEAPTRIDLAGGTLDINPLFHILDRPITVNMGITLNAKVTVRPHESGSFFFNSKDQELKSEGSFHDVTQSQELPLFGLLLKEFWREDWPTLSIESSCLSPAGAGLGGSSCLAISMAFALQYTAQRLGLQEVDDEYDLVKKVQNIETRLIRCPTGCQDYWGAVRGRLNVLSFGAGGVAVETINPEHTQYLSERMLVCYSGRSRASGMNNWSIFKRVFDGDDSLLAKLNQIGQISSKVSEAIRASRWNQVIEMSKEEWQLRKSLWPEIETAETKAIDKAALEAGATLSRVCGAGGGGVMAIFVEPELKNKVAEKVIEAGGQLLDATLSKQGVQVNILEG